MVRHHNLDTEAAVEVLSVGRKSPAAAAGLRAGDVILAFSGRVVSSIDTLQALLRDWPPGKPAVLKFLRRGQGVERTVFPAESRE